MRTCDKVFYEDQAAARLAMSSLHKKAAMKGKPSRLPVRVYPCDVCDGWHLTAKPVQGKVHRGTMTLTGFALRAPRIFSSGPPKSPQGHADNGSEPGGGFLGPPPNAGSVTRSRRPKRSRRPPFSIPEYAPICSPDEGRLIDFRCAR